jgi:hypothetical protein
LHCVITSQSQCFIGLFLLVYILLLFLTVYLLLPLLRSFCCSKCELQLGV